MKQTLMHTAALRRAALTIVLVLILVACAAPAPITEQPTSAPPDPSQTPMVVIETVVEKVVETVVVTVVARQPPTEIPSSTPLPAPTEIHPTQPPAPTAAVADPSGGLITVDNFLGAGWFVDLTRTRSDFALRCQPSKEITFHVKPIDPNITQVEFYYRIGDRSTGAVFDWQNGGRMVPHANGGFTLVFTGESVNANFRKPNAWFDYQFIGLSKTGGVVGRIEKIIQQVSYTLHCP